MSRFRLSEVVGWLGLSLGLVVLFRIGRTDGPWLIVIGTAAIAAAAFMVLTRSLAGLTTLQRLLVEGRPRPMLRIIKRRLRYRGGGNDRSPLLIYQAAAYSMSGEFDKGLLALEEITVPRDLPVESRESWAFAYASTRFSCLLFAERIEEARALYDQSLSRYAKSEELETTVRAMEAQLHYCEGEHIKAERIFEDIVADTTTPPAARAVFHYFLGRICADRGQRSQADEQFEQARALAPNTWLPAGIDALERSSPDTDV